MFGLVAHAYNSNPREPEAEWSGVRDQPEQKVSDTLT
jgi:hypothetical protein